MRASSLACAALLLLTPLGGCAAEKPDYLYVDPQAQPVRLQLRKSFGRFEQHYEPVSISECVVYEAADPSEPYPQEIWRVVSVVPDQPVAELRYGELPAGFLQSRPAGVPPPPLQPGHHYSARCSGDTAGSSEFVIPELVTRPASPLR